jgi:glutamyl-tRNA reductase
MSDYDKMKISDMRKMLKEHRKNAIAPVGKMSKIAIMQEMDKYSASGSMPEKSPVVKGQESAVKQIVKEVKTPAKSTLKTPKKKEESLPMLDYTQKSAHESKKQVDKNVEPKNPIARTKLIKGSQEARDFMAMIRMKKTKKDDVS